MNLDNILAMLDTVQLEDLLYNAYGEEGNLAAEYDDVQYWIDDLLEIDQLLQLWK